jgi:hypothetical protein
LKFDVKPVPAEVKMVCAPGTVVQKMLFSTTPNVPLLLAKPR